MHRHYKSAGDLYRGTQIPNSSLTNAQHVSASDQTVPSLQLQGMSSSYLPAIRSVDPKVWGPPLWYTLHNGAAHYPESASPICAARMKGFILGLPYLISCEECSNHARAYIEKNQQNLDAICSGRNNLFAFWVDMHNRVNARHGKPAMSVEEAANLYMP